LELTLLQCSRCKSGRIAEDDDPYARVKCLVCLACGWEGGYELRPAKDWPVYFEGCQLELCESKPEMVAVLA